MGFGGGEPAGDAALRVGANEGGTVDGAAGRPGDVDGFVGEPAPDRAQRDDRAGGERDGQAGAAGQPLTGVQAVPPGGGEHGHWGGWPSTLMEDTAKVLSAGSAGCASVVSGSGGAGMSLGGAARAEDGVEQPVAGPRSWSAGRGISWSARRFEDDRGDLGGQHAAMRDGLDGFAAHVAGVLGDDRRGVVVEDPLDSGDHPVGRPLVGPGCVGSDPSRRDGHGGDDHRAAEVEGEDLPVDAAAHADPGAGGVVAGHGLGRGRTGWARRRGGIRDGRVATGVGGRRAGWCGQSH